MDRDRDMKRYRSMMRGVQAPDRLSDKVLEQARAQEGRCDPTVHDEGRQLDAPAPKRPRVRLLAAAACLVLVVCLASAGVLYATENPGATAPNSFEISLKQPFGGGGGYSGSWYNPETEQFWNGVGWSGYKYGFGLTCTGNNVEEIYYKLEGERAYFEIISEKPYSDHGEEPHYFHYQKSLTFDYDDQYDLYYLGDNDLFGSEPVYNIYSGFPATQEMLDLQESMRTSTDDYREKENQLIRLSQRCAARELSTITVSATVTYSDGTAQTKTYGFAAVDNFNELVEQDIAWRGSDDRDGVELRYRLYEIGAA